MTVTDGRLDPAGRNRPDRQRFQKRGRKALREGVRKAKADGTVTDILEGGTIILPPDSDLSEPRLVHGRGGVHDKVMPGNEEFVAGDIVERPDGKGGKGSAAGKSGSVAYRLTPEEFLDLFLEDFELPDLIRQKLGEVTDEKFSSAGFSTTGSPARMSISRTAAEAFKRRIALGRIKNKRRVKVLRAQLEQCDESDQERRQALEIEIGELEKKLRGVNYLEELDIRYRRYEPEPNPITRAVMFCLMDVSVSMTEHRKDLAKGFYALLYIFLKREYEKVDVVFLRHTHEAEEVDEQTFFRGGESGGTKVSTVYELMSSVIDDRYPPSEWNIYAAEASDGDNDASDSELVAQMLREQLLPMMQYLAYVEVGEETTSHNWTPTKSQLWAALDILHEEGKPVVLRHINKRSEIYPVFTELFGKHSEDRAR